MVLNLLFIAVALVPVAGCAKRLPASFTAAAAGTALLTAWYFRSFERSACSALPLLIAAAVVLAERPRLRRWVTVAAPVVLLAQWLLIFGGWYLP